MSAALIPEGLEPIGVWDANTPDWPRGPFRDRSEWIRQHVGNPNMIYRVTFYLLDTPFAVVDRFAADGNGFKWAENGEAVTETVFAPLGELPPDRLLRQP